MRRTSSAEWGASVMRYVYLAAVVLHNGP
jgi:hypothetical protein